jgi:hypothetical protein
MDQNRLQPFVASLYSRPLRVRYGQIVFGAIAKLRVLEITQTGYVLWSQEMLRMYEPAPDRDHHGVGPVIYIQLLHQVPHVHFHGFLAH